MDYLEGLLLGRLWSDTDFENRKHFGLFIIYGLLVDAIIFYIYIVGKGLLGFGIIGPLHIAVFTLLFLANPFICFRYYRMPWWGKIFILLVLNGIGSACRRRSCSRKRIALCSGGYRHPEPYLSGSQACSIRMGLDHKHTYHQEVFPSKEIIK